MISYDYMREGWMSDRDEEFFIDMTPEGDREELEKTFKSYEEFFEYYYNVDENRKLLRQLTKLICKGISNPDKGHETFVEAFYAIKDNWTNNVMNETEKKYLQPK